MSIISLPGHRTKRPDEALIPVASAIPAAVGSVVARDFWHSDPVGRPLSYRDIKPDVPMRPGDQPRTPRPYDVHVMPGGGLPQLNLQLALLKGATAMYAETGFELDASIGLLASAISTLGDIEHGRELLAAWADGSVGA